MKKFDSVLGNRGSELRSHRISGAEADVLTGRDDDDAAVSEVGRDLCSRAHRAPILFVAGDRLELIL